MSRLAALAIACVLAAPMATFAQEDCIAWLTDINEAKRQATLENKLILLHFSGSFCRPCLNVEKFVFTNPRVGSAITENYIPVKVDVEAQPRLAKEFGIATIPHDVVITPGGQIIAKQASSTNSDGYLRMIDTVAKRAARTNPQTLATAEQIAQSVPEQVRQVENAYVPVGQSPVAPEPLMTMGDMERGSNGPIRTVSGQVLAPSAPDERKLKSEKPQQFVDELKLAPAADSATTDPGQVPVQAANQMPVAVQESRPSQILRPMNQTQLPKSVSLTEITRPSASAYPSRTTPPWESTSSAPNAEATSGDVGQPIGSTPSMPRQTGLPLGSPELPTLPQGLKKASSSLPIGFCGACPATWFATGEFTPGDSRWGCEHRGRLYLFSSRELRDQFRLTPDILSPRLAGYDPVTYATTGELIDGQLEHFVESDLDGTKSIYLFSSADNKATFLANSQKYIDEVRQAIRVADQAADER